MAGVVPASREKCSRASSSTASSSHPPPPLSTNERRRTVAAWASEVGSGAMPLTVSSNSMAGTSPTRERSCLVSAARMRWVMPGAIGCLAAVAAAAEADAGVASRAPGRGRGVSMAGGGLYLRPTAAAAAPAA
eukprot:scaffold5615_cov103-Isochrysis_galbana.AAC.6